VINYFNCTSTC